jgi:hypothetical protein
MYNLDSFRQTAQDPVYGRHFAHSMRCDEDTGDAFFDPCVTIGAVGCIELVGVADEI